MVWNWMAEVRELDDRKCGNWMAEVMELDDRKCVNWLAKVLELDDRNCLAEVNTRGNTTMLQLRETKSALNALTRKFKY